MLALIGLGGPRGGAGLPAASAGRDPGPGCPNNSAMPPSIARQARYPIVDRLDNILAVRPGCLHPLRPSQAIQN